MSTEPASTIEELSKILNLSFGLTDRALITYARLWQLETWLRHLVYTEYKAKYGDSWAEQIGIRKLPNAYKNDKRLTHMPTPEELSISFITFDNLANVISNEWNLFEAYLPLQNIWQAKLAEIGQIRNRIAHFRVGHRDDLVRTEQLLRDIDSGILRYCASFNDYDVFRPPSNDPRDPVIYEFSDVIPYGHSDIESKPRTSYSETIMSKLDISFGVIKRPWAKYSSPNVVASTPGFFYNLHLHGLRGQRIKLDEFLRRTEPVHQHVAYIFLEPIGDVSVIVPAVLPSADLVAIFRIIINVVTNSLWRGPQVSSNIDPRTQFEDWRMRVQMIADQSPEFVLGPNHPMTFVDSETRASVFGF